MSSLYEVDTKNCPVTRAGMAERMRERVIGAATIRGIIVAYALYLGSIAALNLADAPLARIAPGVSKPDLTFGYTYAQLVDILAAYGEAGRQAYALGLIVDTVTPVTFAGVALLVVARAAPRRFWLLAAAPLTFMVLDVIENGLFALMVAQYPEVSPALVVLTGPITMVKLSAYFVALPTLVIGTLLVGYRWLRSRRSA